MYQRALSRGDLALPRLSIEDIRRQQLTEAAYEALQTWGLPGTTLVRVADKAGVSKGIVLHYFRNKDELIEAAMRRANADLRDCVVQRLKLAQSPRERLDAIIDVNFAETFFRPQITHAWLSFCGEVPRNEQFARLQRAIHARMRSNLMSALKHLLPMERAKEAALSISVMIDGLWLRHGLVQGGIDRESALRQIHAHVDRMVT